MMRRGAREGRGADEVEACDVAGGEATGSLSEGGSGGVWLESAHGDSSTSIVSAVIRRYEQRKVGGARGIGLDA